MAEDNSRVPWALHFLLRFLEENLKNVLTSCWCVGIITNNEETIYFDNTRRSGDQGENHQGDGSSRSFDDNRDSKVWRTFFLANILSLQA